MEIFVQNKPILLSPNKIIGIGGEAEIYKVGRSKALKLFKSPSHPDFEGSPRDKKAALERIQEHQTKLLKLPKSFSPSVITPLDLAFDKRGNTIGYTMNMVEGSEVLLKYSQRSFRDGFIPDKQVIEIFRKLFLTVKSVHKAGVIIGDFNDLNVLVKGTNQYLIDFDSSQFDNYFCKVFTGKFVDPLLCDEKAKAPFLIKQHNTLSDWYAYLIMLMQSLIFVGPYGGVYRPKNKAHKIAPDARPLKRVTVFSDEVKYPRPARSLSSLPDLFLQYLQEVFENDKREEFPISIMDNFQFDSSGNLLSTMSEKVSPAREKEIILGQVSAKKIFSTSGRILYATMQDSKLQFIYHLDDTYFREDNTSVTKGTLDPNMRFRINGEKTFIAKGDKAFLLGKNKPDAISIETYGNLPLIDANYRNSFFIQNGNLLRVSDIGSKYSEIVGQVLSNRTLFWVGENLGFGFYKAGGLSRFFVFDSEHKGINDNVKIPHLKGQLIDSTCTFSHNLVWFFVSTRESGKTINRCYLVNKKGQVIASAESLEDSGDWLSSLRRSCGIGNMLFSSTDEGIVRIEADNSQLVVTKEFRDTARFVDSHSFLLPGSSGIIAIKSNQDIWNIQMK